MGRGRIAVGLAIAAALIAAPQAAAQGLPDDDPFYAQPSASELDARSPGAVMRSREVAVTGLGVPLPVKAWQVMYRSGDAKNRPIGAVATVLVPLTPYAGGERPLVSYQVAIDALGTQCNPSYTMRTGTQKELTAIDPLLRAGYAVVVADFEGPRMAYTAGWLAARTVLDGIRAAIAFEPAGLTGTKTPIGLWGYSGGGQATAWAVEQHPGYAPELDIKAAAEGGVPPDLEQVARQIDGGPFFGVYFGAGMGLSREYAEIDVDSLLNERGKALREEMKDECAEDLVLGHPGGRMSDHTTVPDPLVVPRVQRVIEANRLGKATPTAPIYIYHSALDELIPVAGPDALVAEYCREGAKVFYQRDVSGEHVAYAVTSAPPAIAYLAERFEDGPVLTNCAEAADPEAPRPPGPARPAISRLRVEPRALRRSSRKGVKVSYYDTQASTTTFTVLRRTRGGGKKVVGSFSRTDRAGANSFRYKGRGLAPGSYRLRAVPRHGTETGASVPASFRVVR